MDRRDTTRHDLARQGGPRPTRPDKARQDMTGRDMTRPTRRDGTGSGVMRRDAIGLDLTRRDQQDRTWPALTRQDETGPDQRAATRLDATRPDETNKTKGQRMSSHKIRQRVLAEMEKDGRITPRRLVDAARNETHPLHKDFIWDDRTAAEKHRLDRAREIIQSVRVIVTTDTQRISSVGYVRDPSVGPHAQGYVSVARLQTDSDMAYEALQHEAGRIAALVERARQFAVVVNLEDELEDILRSIARLRASASPMMESPQVQPTA
jgi:hypothetical protein